MKTITEINKYKFLEMVAFCDAYKGVYGEMPTTGEVAEKFGETRTKLFYNMVKAFDNSVLRLPLFVRATLRDDGFIEYKHYRK